MSKLDMAKGAFKGLKQWWGGSTVAQKAGTAADYAQSGVTGGRLKDLKANPLTYGFAGAYFGQEFAGEVTHPARRGISRAWQELPEQDRHVAIKREREMRLQSTLDGIEDQQRSRAMMTNAARLAATRPQLYNEVMAGRRLPAGAVMFGGRPRVDLLEQLAADMTDGRFPQEQSPQQQLADLLGA